MPVKCFIRSAALVVAFTAAVTSTTALAAPTNPPTDKTSAAEPVANDIAAAGRLRMQSQRLAKLYQQLGMGINGPATTRQIEQTLAEMDGELPRLYPLAKKQKIKPVLARCEALWQDLRTILKLAPNPAARERVGQLADELMLHSGKLAMLIEAEAETPVGRLLDLSSRLNMLSQRLARLYLLAQGGDRSQGVLIDIEQARKEFAVGLNELDTAKENSQASRDAIGLARNQWIFFESAIGQLNRPGQADGKALLNVVTSSERIAEALEAAQAQYIRDYVSGLRPAK